LYFVPPTFDWNASGATPSLGRPRRAWSHLEKRPQMTRPMARLNVIANENSTDDDNHDIDAGPLLALSLGKKRTSPMATPKQKPINAKVAKAMIPQPPSDMARHQGICSFDQDASERAKMRMRSL
jgi:hypothetical protein